MKPIFTKCTATKILSIKDGHFRRISPLTRWQNFDQVELSRHVITHRLTMTNFMDTRPIPVTWA
jgi:hypothetical protein